MAKLVTEGQRMKQAARRQNPKYKSYQRSIRKTNKYRGKRKLFRQKLTYKSRKSQYVSERRKIDPIFCLVTKLRKHLGRRLTLYSENGKTKHSCEYGINYKKIVEYLKPTLSKQEDNHVDHIVPISCFDLNNNDQIQLCFSPENLQWLLGPENCSKNDQIRKQDIVELQRRFREDTEELDAHVLIQLITIAKAVQHGDH